MEVKGEIWKEVAGYEGLYQVSNRGRVKSLGYWIYGEGRGFPRKKKERILTPCMAGTKYYFVTLAHRGSHKMALIHRLVAEAFLPNPLKKSDVNHKDGNKLNNDVRNLEWCTRQENIRHAFANGLSKPHHNQVNRKRVEITDNTGGAMEFSSVADAARFIGVCESGVSRACSGFTRSAGGYWCRFI